MCGILGLISPIAADMRRFEGALARLSHRGPETSRIENLGPVTLGFCRLSIQDLSPAGNQPMSDPAGNCWIVFNGEIYNFRELKSELEAMGCQFRSRSDTEVILQGYLKWGWTALLDRLEGMFAFGIYDKSNQRLLLARDRIGIKPLFFTEDTPGLVFASEIKAITAYIGPRMLNRGTSLNPILTTGVCPPGTTMFQDIQELEPGCYLDYDLTKNIHHIHRYFDIGSLVSSDSYSEMAKMPGKELIVKHAEVLEKSVSSHLISDAKLGVMFSAGLDSSLVAAIACQAGRPDLALYYFYSQKFDVKDYAQSFQKKFSADLKILDLDEQEVIFDLPKMIYNYETINKEEGTILSNVCRAAKTEGCKVLLTGDGSDELFGGYLTHWSFYTRSVLHNTPAFNFILRVLKKVVPGLERFGDDPRETDYFLSPSDLKILEPPVDILFHGGTRSAAWNRCLAAYDFVSNPTERNTAAYLLSDLIHHLPRYLTRADRMGMKESVELRVPYLHLPVVRMAVNTPVKWRIGRTLFSRKPEFPTLFNGKRIMREVAKRYHVPMDIIYRKKRGTPFDGQDQVRSLLASLPLKNVSDFFQVPETAIRNVLLESSGDGGGRIRWSILSTEILIREFVDEESHENIADEFRRILHVSKSRHN